MAQAHNKGMEVWALLENLNPDVSTYEIMSYTSKRERLEQNLISEVLAVGADGINLDFEQISYDAGEHYVQFIREMSVACRRRGIVLSVDNYPPQGGSNYNLTEQGKVVDYVIIMGYDEHKLEVLTREVANRELRGVTLWGGVIGAVVGLSMSVVMWLIG